MGSSWAQAATIAYWRFEEGTANTTATGVGSILDSSGNGHHGTPNNGPIYRSTTFPGSTLGLEFDGVDDFVFIPDDADFQLTQSLTLEAFVRVDSYPTGGSNPQNQIIFRGDDRAGKDPYFLRVIPSGLLAFSINTLTSGASVFSAAALPLGQPLHVAGTLEDTTGDMKVFVNGVEVFYCSST